MSINFDFNMRTFIYENKSHDLCYGCRACEQVCPKQAISMIPDQEGFIYPVIDQTKCIDCDLCKKVCPTQDANKEHLLHSEQTKVYAAWNNDLQLRLKSTSGGIFYTLALQFIHDGGVVYGATMNNDFTVTHCRVSLISDLVKLRGSKYVQSNTLNTFKQVKEDLIKGYKVLYSGTPCQIAGLRGFLRKEYKNLYTVDLVCHGTPSPHIFKCHIKYLENTHKKRLNTFLFRDKKESGWRAYVSYVFSNRQKQYRTTQNDFYCYCFYNGWLSRKSCYICEYSQARRVGDITLSDFWGGEQVYKQLKIQRKYGYNLVICNTAQGQQLFDKISHDITHITCEMAAAKTGDVRLRHSEEKPSLRDKIYIECRGHGYEYIVNKYKYHPSFIRRMTPLWVINLVKEVKSRL